MVKMQVSNKLGYQLLMRKTSKTQNAKPAKNYGSVSRRERNGSNIFWSFLSFFCHFRLLSAEFQTEPLVAVLNLVFVLFCVIVNNIWSLGVSFEIHPFDVPGLRVRFVVRNWSFLFQNFKFWSKMTYFEPKKANSIFWAIDTRI